MLKPNATDKYYKWFLSDQINSKSCTCFFSIARASKRNCCLIGFAKKYKPWWSTLILFFVVISSLHQPDLSDRALETSSVLRKARLRIAAGKSTPEHLKYNVVGIQVKSKKCSFFSWINHHYRVRSSSWWFLNLCGTQYAVISAKRRQRGRSPVMSRSSKMTPGFALMAF